MQGLLIVVVSLVEHRLQSAWASVIMAHRPGCPVTCGIFLDQASNLCPLDWQANSYPPDQGSPSSEFLECKNEMCFTKEEMENFIEQDVDGF